MRSGSFANPRPLVEFDCGSQSTSSVFTSAAAKDAARLMAVVVLPTPPFWLATAMTRPMDCKEKQSYRSIIRFTFQKQRAFLCKTMNYVQNLSNVPAGTLSSIDMRTLTERSNKVFLQEHWVRRAEMPRWNATGQFTSEPTAKALVEDHFGNFCQTVFLISKKVFLQEHCGKLLSRGLKRRLRFSSGVWFSPDCPTSMLQLL